MYYKYGIKLFSQINFYLTPLLITLINISVLLKGKNKLDEIIYVEKNVYIHNI